MIKLIKRSEIERRLDISKSQFYKLRKVAGFPKPVSFPRGSRCKRYLVSDLEAFIHKQIEQQSGSNWAAA